MRDTDLFDLEEIQKIQNTFAISIGMASIITEPDGTPICNDIIRKTPKSLSNCMKSDTKPGKPNQFDLLSKLAFQNLQLMGQDKLLKEFNEKIELTVRQRIVELEHANRELKKTLEQLQEAFDKVKTLKGIVPICASCKRIRDNKGYWNQIESYFKEHADVDFSHGICPECSKKLYPEYD